MLTTTEAGAAPRILAISQTRVQAALARCLPPGDTHPARLHQAMRYVVLGTGKAIRPALVYATAEALSIDLDRVDVIACALELIHAYSLVHDDLPAMDDDDLRRGRPTCHIAYDEATAILVGDALQTLAFQLLAQDARIDAAIRVQMIDKLALAAGSRGMVGGQAIDLEAVGKTLNIAELEDMHIRKTGALIRASVQLPALLDTIGDSKRFQALDHYAKCLGLAFQIHDDVLDVEGHADTLGKTPGADQARDKPSYSAMLGVQEARRRAHELCAEAIAGLSGFSESADSLRELCRFSVTRQR